MKILLAILINLIVFPTAFGWSLLMNFFFSPPPLCQVLDNLNSDRFILRLVRGTHEWLMLADVKVCQFQVILNMRLRTTGGQALPSVVLMLMGKTTDFLSNYLLLLPPQYVVMTYFSSSLTYINGIQVINGWRACS